MTAARGVALTVGITAGFLMLAGAGYLQALETERAHLYASVPFGIAPIPADLLPPGTKPPPAPKPLSLAQKNILSSSLWRDPLQQHLVNLIYIEAVRANGRTDATGAIATVLAKLGWRYTPAQQNLMLRAALDGQYSKVIDHADALLRRQKLTAQAMTMLMAMEAVPQVHQLVVERLLEDPMWRTGYLMRFSLQSPPAVLSARFETMQSLLRSAGGVTLQELAPTISALVANGRAQDAYTLWSLKKGPIGVNLVRDPHFEAAAKNAGDGISVPFEWNLNQGLGYSTDAGSEGATISWDGNGVPVFMTQLVPVEPNHKYVLAIHGSSTSGTALETLLKPSLTCGQNMISFTPVAQSAGMVRFQSEPIPAGCDMATLSIGSSVDAANGDVTISVSDVDLRREK